MRFLANENFPFPSIRLTQEAGYEVLSISENNSGISDEEVLNQAIHEELIILTFDRDYSELLFKYKKEPPPAVVYFRLKGNNPKDAGNILLNQIISSHITLEGLFTVIEETGIRQRKLR